MTAAAAKKKEKKMPRNSCQLSACYLRMLMCNFKREKKSVQTSQLVTKDKRQTDSDPDKVRI